MYRQILIRIRGQEGNTFHGKILQILPRQVTPAIDFHSLIIEELPTQAQGAIGPSV